MKELIQESIDNWKKELIIQKKILQETNTNILMIEGGIQFGQAQLKKLESSDQPTNKVDIKRQSKKAQLNS